RMSVTACYRQLTFTSGLPVICSQRSKNLFSSPCCHKSANVWSFLSSKSDGQSCFCSSREEVSHENCFLLVAVVLIGTWRNLPDWAGEGRGHIGSNRTHVGTSCGAA